MSNEFRLPDYLTRIGFRGKVQPDLATLAAIHAAHVDALPFEGIDPLLSRPVKLDLASLQEKLLDRRRGGYCFEQNSLFKAALEAIGFNVTGLCGLRRLRAGLATAIQDRYRAGYGDGHLPADRSRRSVLAQRQTAVRLENHVR